MNGNGRMNGTAKTLGVVVLVLGLVGSIFGAGISYNRIYDHVVDDKSIHQNTEEKQAAFDRRFDLRIAPVERDIEYIKKQQAENSKKLDKILDKLP